MFDTQHVGHFSPKVAFALVSFALGELGDGLNIFQGIYLVNMGWSEGSVGIALSLMGLTALLVQTVAGDIVDKTLFDRRLFLVVASIVTALSASAILLVQGDSEQGLMYGTKVIEGIASSFIGPCLASLTLANFGPEHFDAIMASNILWGHIGSVISALLAGSVAYIFYPNIQYCFFVIGLSALIAIVFVRFVPQGDPLMGRGFQGDVAMDEQGNLERVPSSMSDMPPPSSSDIGNQKEGLFTGDPKLTPTEIPEASSYLEVFSDRKTLVLCITGWSFHFANANVLLVLGELMGQAGDNDDDGPSRSAIPLIAGAIVLAQATMSLATIVGGKLTDRGIGRKPLFMAGLLTLPLRCALIIMWQDMGDSWLLSTQILDGLGGGFFGLLHPLLVADITFGSGRFNVIMGLTASCFGLGGTMSNFFGQMVVEYFGHTASLAGSFFISIFPIILFGVAMPETLGNRGQQFLKHEETKTKFVPLS
ncbi:unnamed protein product [Cylindrotheca closterium]|uniref:Major facilitator superfamily (MFS) profile domain-containing protein n=1 Tax=Cylindrotheca closterium TaxID=2856 RepID=A0AAD2G5J7_9STRA|nr:unnamed protein product [Cylindrotheca closterium]